MLGATAFICGKNASFFDTPRQRPDARCSVFHCEEIAPVVSDKVPAPSPENPELVAVQSNEDDVGVELRGHFGPRGSWSDQLHVRHGEEARPAACLRGTSDAANAYVS